MNIAPQTRQKPPVAAPAAAPSVTRVIFSDLLPQTPTQQFAKALAAAGWSLDVSAVMLVNGVKKAKLESLPLAFSDWLTKQGQHPSADRFDSLCIPLQSDVLKFVPRVGVLL